MKRVKVKLRAWRKKMIKTKNILHVCSKQCLTSNCETQCLTPKLSVTLLSRLSSTKGGFLVLQKKNRKNKKTAGTAPGKGEKENAVMREGTRTPFRAQKPQDLGRDVHPTPEPQLPAIIILRQIYLKVRGSKFSIPV